MDLKKNWCAVKTCYSVEPQSHVILSNPIFIGKTKLDDFIENKNKTNKQTFVLLYVCIICCYDVH